MIWLSATSESEVVVMVVEISSAQQRSQNPQLFANLSLPNLLAILPLSLPVPDNTPPSPKSRYRSQYLYLGYQDLLADQTLWSVLSSSLI